MQHAFSPAVSEQLGYYVYRLIDPATGEDFYVGKGKGSRIFQHLSLALAHPTRSDKLDRIRAIHERGQEVRHLIHRHGLTEVVVVGVGTRSLQSWQSAAPSGIPLHKGVAPVEASYRQITNLLLTPLFPHPYNELSSDRVCR